MNKEDFNWDVRTWSEAKDTLEALSNEYVPSSGSADTVLGEMLRAVNRICYRFYNDGDFAGYYYGVETVAPSCAYLLDEAYVACEDAGADKNLLADLVDTVHCLFEHTPGSFPADRDYENNLKELVNLALKVIEDVFDELSSAENTVNSVKHSLDVLKYEGIELFPEDDEGEDEDYSDVDEEDY